MSKTKRSVTIFFAFALSLLIINPTSASADSSFYSSFFNKNKISTQNINLSLQKSHFTNMPYIYNDAKSQTITHTLSEPIAKLKIIQIKQEESTTPALLEKKETILEIEKEQIATVSAQEVEATPAPSNTPQTSLNPGGLNPETIFEMVNTHRQSINLPILEKEPKVCALAQSRAPEIGAEISGGYMHQGLKDRQLDYWNSENIISMRSEKEAVDWWLNDYIHKIAIEGDYKYSCVACLGNSCVQEFTNLQSKN